MTPSSRCHNSSLSLVLVSLDAHVTSRTLGTPPVRDCRSGAEALECSSRVFNRQVCLAAPLTRTGTASARVCTARVAHPVPLG
ncbi:hypothetical protein L226DRAFT_331597 [Lentinus tigrinus ALCF2SS1-7]|uniref:uncharacterized protein n=1 Tax=Lentinus tigrinus ALCF2SS1-7 TaxID=1328758 RepID=UPI0011661BED|nr:hypothetical protein L226DRAFT_331597 [Lentinus tigrinus ALCF2SS1-7]